MHPEGHHWLQFYQQKPTFLFGANPEIEDVLLRQGCHQLRVFDDKLKESMRPCESWAAGFAEIINNPEDEFTIHCGVGSTPRLRRQAVARVEAELESCNNWEWGKVISELAHVSSDARLGPGTVVCDMCYVGPFVGLGPHVVMIAGAAVHHDSSVGAFSILVGGSRILGRAKLGDDCRICCGAVILPEARLGHDCTVGAQQVVKSLVSWETQDHGS